MSSLERFISELEITQGGLAGQRFELLPWQRRFLRGAFGGDAQVSALSVARGNGKSTLIAAVAAATVGPDGPLATRRGETLVVAGSLVQARIVRDHCAEFLRVQYDDFDDKRVWRRPDAPTPMIHHLPTDTRLKLHGYNPDTILGAAPSLAILDEPSSFGQGGVDDGSKMFAAISTALGKQKNSRMVCLGTQPTSGDHFFARLLDGGADYIQLHAARDDDPPHWERTWKRANPSYGAMPDLADTIRRESDRAKRDAGWLEAFKAYRLNQRVDPVQESMLVTPDSWRACEGDAEKTGRPIWGIDLGTTSSQSAVAAVWESGRLDAFGAFPTEPDLRARGIKDGVDDLYQVCERQGDLVTAGQYTVNVQMVVNEALDRFGRPSAIVCDTWREGELREALEAVGFPLCDLVVRRQGYKDGGEDVRLFRRAVADRRVQARPSKFLRHSLGETRTIVDAAGNHKLTRRRQRSANDAAVASVISVGEWERRRSKPRSGGLRYRIV